MREVAAEVDDGLELDGWPEGTAEQSRKQLARGLHPALRPPPLLHQQCGRRARKLGRYPDIVAHDEPPAGHLGPVADVQIFREGVVLPASRVDEGLAAPQPRGPVEVEETAPAVARTLLHQEVPVEEEALGPGQPRRRLVEVVPAGLHHPDAGVGHGRQQLLEEAGVGDEVRVEDEDVLSGCRFEAFGEGARLVAGAVRAVVDRDVDAPLAPAPRAPPGEEGRLVGGVVQYLDLEVGGGVGEPARRVDEPLGDMLLVVDGELHGDAGGWGGGGRSGRPRAAAHRSPPPRKHQQQHPMSRERQQQRQDQSVEHHRQNTQCLDHRRASPGSGRIPMNAMWRPVSPRRWEK